MSKGVQFIGIVIPIVRFCSFYLGNANNDCVERNGFIMFQYSKDEVIQFVNEEDVKFIRLAFCDIYGK